MGYSRNKTIEEPEGELDFTESAVTRWANALSMYVEQNPHISIEGGKIRYEVCDDGSLMGSIDGTTLRIRVKEGEWSWKR